MKTAKLPNLLSSKIYKTGQTRGADDDVIFQNRVNRNNTVLIPHSFYETCKNAPDNNGKYENSFIVLVNPEEYFTNKTFPVKLKKQGLEIGKNALLFYYSREQWSKFPPANMSPAESRTSPLGGEYVARVPATTSSSDKKIQHGFASSQLKGAGIRVYEYASQQTIRLCQIQLKYIYWQCFDSEEVSRQEGMTKEQVFERRKYIQQEVLMLRLQDKTRLVEARIL
ncbi:MAG: BstXI family restriction endonuclease, partial [Gloeotrichia echinulata HAB0833]